MNESAAQQLADRFDELGLRFLEPIDLADLPVEDTVLATLAHDQGEAPYRLGYSDPLTLSSSDWVKPHYVGPERLLLVGPRATERSAEMFRRLGINYIDHAGNAFIAFDGVHIDVRGRRAPIAAETTVPRMTRGGVNLFSTKRSQIVFALLSWPELLGASVRDLATAAGTSLGQAQETLGLLTHYGFLDDRKRFAAHQRERLVDQWAASFPSGLGSSARTGRFSGDWKEFHPRTITVYLSGEAAVPELLRAETAVMYTAEFPTELIRAHRWRRNDEQPNILLRHQFWKTPATETPGVIGAPWPLVYADLLAAEDGRQREAAQKILEQNL